MKLTPELLRHLEALARIELDEEERAAIADDLQRILAYVEAIGELELEGVAPLTRPIEEAARLREDAPAPSLPREEVLKNAPEREDGFFKVPRSVE